MRLFVLTSFLFGLVGCATTSTPEPKGGPRGLRASEHLDAAHQHDAIAHERQLWPETHAMVPGDLQQPVALPWYRSWDTSGEHTKLAEAHRAKAAELYAEYEAACGEAPGSEATVSPLESYGIGGWNTATGVIVYLSPEVGAPDQLLAKLRCHRAAMMLAPAGMDDCPLDLPDITIDARGDAEEITVSIGVRDPKLVPELQRRAAHDLEAANQVRGRVHGQRH